MRGPDPLVVVQARTGSTRLPGKVLQEVGGQPMLAFQLARLAQLAEQPGLHTATVVVATSELPQDDAVAEVAGAAGVGVVRGSETDVLTRFVAALDAHQADTVVRLTGDCPLTDPAIVAAAVELHRESGADYTSNVLPRSFPKGLDVEVASAAALRAAAAEATAPEEREHVTPFLYRRPGRFGLANLHSGLDLGEEWWTVDRPEDMDRIRAMVAMLEDPIAAGWRTILEAVGIQDPHPPGPTLRPLPTAVEEQGRRSDGWARRWQVVVDGSVVGVATVVAGEHGVRREYEGDETGRSAASATLDRLLVADLQARA